MTIDVVLRLSARDLVHADLASCGWAGSEHHLAGVGEQLERARTGEVDYLAVCPATDIPVAKGGVDYQVKEGVGTVWQLAVHPALQSCGIGTFLMEAAEQRIRNRGLRQAELAVEESNPRACALYRRLGYVAYDRRPDAWNVQAPDGSLRRYETMCTLMRKDLS
ncbi:GNAT family N-acetyltransferase [Streptomyces sp. AB3(2024)]|uniref:GNAT family N-acetyltransferase n=1 Tax=Streptomyces sp. AB3(2024) TaxID=3317321 RepID=UPI0035A2695F